MSDKLHRDLRDWMERHNFRDICSIPAKQPTLAAFSDTATKDQLLGAASAEPFAKMVAIYWRDLYNSDEQLIKDAIGYYKYNESNIQISQN